MNAVKNTIILLRFPFSVYLLPVFLFALSQVDEPKILESFVVFVVLHLLVYPASNGYNSYMDQDTDSIGGLEHPPKSTKLLLYSALCLDVMAVLISFLLINDHFTLMVIGYIVASRAYSSRAIRLKKYPIVSFLIVAIFQGGYTFLMVILGCTDLDLVIVMESQLIYAAVASSLMIGGGYPLTQIYQYASDEKNGDQTLSMLLNYRGTFLFSMVMFLIASLLMLIYFFYSGEGSHFLLFQVFTLPLLVWFIIWMRRVWKNSESANFKNTMKMNNISAVCLNLFYATLVVSNHFMN